MGPDVADGNPVDQVLAEELDKRRSQAREEAEAAELAASRWRNVEAACHNGLETLQAGFGVQSKDHEVRAGASALTPLGAPGH